MRPIRELLVPIAAAVLTVSSLGAAPARAADTAESPPVSETVTESAAEPAAETAPETATEEAATQTPAETTIDTRTGSTPEVPTEPATDFSAVDQEAVEADAGDDGQATTAADITLSGVGYGHGVGFSQYGARTRAQWGHSAQQILSAYYPNTTLSAAPAARVRVLLTRYDGMGTCRNTPETGQVCMHVPLEPGQQFVNLASGAAVTVPADINGQRVSATTVGSGPSGLRMWALAGSWQPIAGGASFTGPVEIRNPDNTVTTIYANGTYREYRGVLRMVRANSTSIHRVNVLTMDEYLLGVVPDEMPASWETAAVQAQGVAAATYATRSMRNAGTMAWDLCDTTQCQVYGGRTSESSAATQKLQSSPLRGRILSSGGVPITALFSSSNGGYSVSGGTSYLPARADSADPNNLWSRRIPGQCMSNKYPGRGSFNGVTVLNRDGRGAYGGRVTRLRLNFTNGSVTVGPASTPMATDSAIRAAFSGCGEAGNLRSSLFTVSGSTTPTPTGPGIFAPGQTLTSGQSFPSASGQHSIQVGSGWWIGSRTCAGTRPTGTGGGRLIMQPDGNLVWYGSGNTWSSATSGNPGAYAAIQDDGNLVVYSPNGRVLWHAGAGCTTAEGHDRAGSYNNRPNPARMQPGDSMYSRDRSARLLMQPDGNLVLYRGTRVLWHAGTAGNPGAHAVVQGDGNFVVYSAANRPLWHLGTVFAANAPNLADSHLVVVQPDRIEMLGVQVDTNTGARSQRLIWRS